MKKTALLSISIMIMIVMIFTSCKKETGPAGPTGPSGTTGATGPILSGTLEGYVQLYDMYGNRVYHPQDSTSLQINSTTVLTDTTGKYSFTLTTGTYNVNILSRPADNYGSTIIEGLQFSGGGTFERDAAISKIPNFTISTLTVKDTSFPAANPVQYVKFSGTVSSSDTKARTLAVFVNDNSVVSSSTAQYLAALDPANSAVAANGSTFTFYLKSANIYAGTGLSPSQTAYFAVYPAAVNWYNTSNYLDYGTDRKIYTAIGTTPMLANVIMQ